MLARSLLVTLCCCASAVAAGVTGRGGFEAVAASLDGKQLAVGGQNRVVYLLDAASRQVRRRVWLGTRIGGLAFSKDGKRLVAEDETDQLYLLETDSGKVLVSARHGSSLVASPAADLAACRDAGQTVRHRLRLLSLDRLEEVGVVDLPERPVAWTFDATGKKLFVLSAGRPGDEKRIPAAEAPRELRGLARWVFRQKNDGLESAIYHVEVPSGKVASVTRSWYTSDSDDTHLVRLSERTFAFNRANLCARIDDRGDTVMFETAQPVNYAVAASPDGKVLLLGGQGEGSHGPIEGDKRESFRLEPLPGQAEIFNRFAVAADGSAWAVTSAYRLVRINKLGRIEQVVPVY